MDTNLRDNREWRYNLPGIKNLNRAQFFYTRPVVVDYKLYSGNRPDANTRSRT